MIIKRDKLQFVKGNRIAHSLPKHVCGNMSKLLNITVASNNLFAFSELSNHKQKEKP